MARTKRREGRLRRRPNKSGLNTRFEPAMTAIFGARKMLTITETGANFKLEEIDLCIGCLFR